jgi:glutamate carboxypeptidase
VSGTPRTPRDASPGTVSGTVSGKGTAASSARLLEHLEQRRDDMTQMLVRLIEHETPSDHAETQAGAQRILRDAFETLGYRVRHVRGRSAGGSLLAVPESRRRGAPVQMLLGHCDTVWPLGTLETMPAEVRDGKLYGPGGYDMKAGLVHMIFAVAALREHGLDPEVVPIVFINSDEEIGSLESRDHIRRLGRHCDRVFVLEPSLGPDGRLKTARKGVGRFTVRVRGRAAHAGLDPERGVSAILELSHVIQALFALNDPDRGVTVNVGTIDGGIRPNVVAAESSATADVRILDPEDAERIDHAIRAIASIVPGTELVVEGGFGRPPLERTPGNRELWARACGAAAELGFELVEGTAGGGSDGSFTSVYTPTLDGLGAVGDGAHAIGEHVTLEHMPRRTALLARLLLDPPMPRQRETSTG